ncbi:hypothetical protein SAMN05421503_2042 [Terribacillus aidingensis]|uniref:Uncharacterized protein n=1 Tax=Terribacillus aidingensis TaxID=586416 RepID=A0A285NR46_9BACI|nr:hypothetical protein SAMN05421503_2042 [Terribacillus aidingensis]
MEDGYFYTALQQKKLGTERGDQDESKWFEERAIT